MDNKLPLFLTSVYNNYIPTHVTNIYLYCEQECLNNSMFSQIQNLPNIEHIFILDSPSKSGYVGFDKMKNILVHEYNIDYRVIIPVPFLYENENMINTYNESLSLVDYLYKNFIEDLVVLAPVFHLPRAVLTLVSVIINNCSQDKYINIYSLAGNINNWTTKVLTHSQGKLTGTVNELFESEMKKIEDYTKKGDLLEIDRVLEYLQK